MNYLFLFFLSAILTSCNANKFFPDKMPADFKIEYHYDGGMANTSRTITLQTGKCSDEGRDEGIPYEYEWDNKDVPGLENLYAELKKIKAFTLKSTDGGQVYDRGGESMRFTINGKDYNVSDSQSNFITKGDAAAFNKAIEIILAYTKANRVKKKYSQSDFPEKMPEGFAIEYQSNEGMGNRTIYLTKETGLDQGVRGNKTFNNSWKNTSSTAFENLYIELQKLNAFALQYDEIANEGDKEEITIKYTINNNYYVACNSGNYVITREDLPTFNESVNLILAYCSDNSGNNK